MHISPGTGTTFVPFRFFARPEVTELVLHPARPRVQQSS
jgi:predicted MPP superfamily phosphohydrolase